MFWISPLKKVNFRLSKCNNLRKWEEKCSVFLKRNRQTFFFFFLQTTLFWNHSDTNEASLVTMTECSPSPSPFWGCGQKEPWSPELRLVRSIQKRDRAANSLAFCAAQFWSKLMGNTMCRLIFLKHLSFQDNNINFMKWVKWVRKSFLFAGGNLIQMELMPSF